MSMLERRARRPTHPCSRAGTVATMVAAVLGLSGAARGEGWTAVPSLTVAAVYDDNLFFRETARAGIGLRVGPGLVVRYQPSSRLMFDARTDVQGEYFGDPEVSRWAASRTAALSGRYRVGPRTTATLAGQYMLTSYPGELLPSAGLSYGRRLAEGLGAELVVEHRFAPKVTLRGGYGVHVLRMERGRRGLSSQLSGDTRFIFLVAPHTTLTLNVGPRYIERSLSPHVGASLEHDLPRAHLSLGYDRGRTLVFDRAAVIESYTARLSYRLSRALSVTASPSLHRYWESLEERRSWRFTAQATYRASRLVEAFAGYDYGVQESGLSPDFFVVGASGRPLVRNAAIAGFTITPWREEQKDKETSR